MSKEELEKFPNHIENNSNETEPTKNLCVHELRRRLKNKQRKESIVKTPIETHTLETIIFLLNLSFFF